MTVTAITASVCYGEQRSISTSHEEKQKNAALKYLSLLSNGELKIKEHTAISKHCSTKRLAELETHVKLSTERYFNTNHLFEIEELKTVSNFAAALVKAANLSNPLDTHILPVALLLRDDKWIPAPLLGSFSNTGYGYDLKTEQSVKALETWMAEGKKRHDKEYREKSLDSFKDKLIDIEQEAGFDNMSPQEVVTYFIEQLKSKNTLGIVASLGIASDKGQNQIMEAVKIATEIFQTESQDSNSNWAYMKDSSSLSLAIKENQDTGEVFVGCLNPKAGNFQFSRWTQKIFIFQTNMVEGKRTIKLRSSKGKLSEPKELGFQKEHLEFRKQFSTLIFNKIQATECDTPKHLLEHLLATIKRQDFTRFMGLIPHNNEYSDNEKNHKFIVESAAYYWNNLKLDDHACYDLSQVVMKNGYALAELYYSKPDTGDRYRSEEVWMFRDKDGWRIAPLKLITDYLATNDNAEPNVLDELKKQIHKKNIELAFSQTVQTDLPLPLTPLSEELAKSKLHDYLEKLGNGDISASLAHCVVLRGTDKNKLMEHLERMARGIKDESEDIHILGTVTKAGWVGISGRVKSSSSGLYDYPLYLVANTQGGPKVFLNLDLRYPRNSGRLALNEDNWKTFKKAAPETSIKILEGIAKEHYQLCKKDIADKEQ